MTDTPIAPATFPPPSRVDQLKGFFGDLARPYAIIAIATAESFTIFNGKDAGIITAGGVILAGLYAAKTVEVQQAGKQAASIEIAKASGAGAAP